MNASIQPSGGRGTWAIVARPVAFVFAEPGNTTNVNTQLRHGDAVVVRETRDINGCAWCLVEGGALGDPARGECGWIDAAALVPAEQAFGGGVDLNTRTDTNREDRWLRVTSLVGQCFEAASRKQDPAVIDLPGEAWLRRLDTATQATAQTKPTEPNDPPNEQPSILDDNAWPRVALADGREVFIQAGDVTTSELPALADGAALVREAHRLLGRPYVWGGSSTFGLDCSGLTALLARRSALRLILPHSAGRQFEETWNSVTKIGDDRTVDDVAQGKRGDEHHPGTSAWRLAEDAQQRWGALLQPGDFLFFAMNAQRVDHVGVYAGPPPTAEPAPPPGASASDLRLSPFDSVPDFIHASSSGQPCVKRQGLFHETPLDTGTGQLCEPEPGTARDLVAEGVTTSKRRTPWAMRMVGVRRLSLE